MSTEFFARRLSTLPLIFIAPNTETMPIGPVSVLGPLVGDRPLHALICLAWTIEKPHYTGKFVSAYRQHMTHFPKHRLIFLCNTAVEVNLLRAEDIPAAVCNTNLFVDERVFRINSNARKDFDAIYVAVLSRYKRHMLCRELGRVALVYYDPQTRSNPDYIAELKKNLPNAVFVNEEYAHERRVRPLYRRAETFINDIIADRGHINLRPQEVAECINRARVGLCLSEEEGQMAASMEYLLCGIPIVSTPSRGGRNYFFDSRFCAIVDPDPRAVAQAVDEFAKEVPSPETIRATVRARVERARSNLQAIVQRAFEQEAIMPRFIDAWRNMPLGFWPSWTVERFLSNP